MEDMNNGNGKIIDIIFSVLNAFLEYQSLGTLRVKDSKPYTLIVFEKKKNKVPKQDSQNWLRSPMSEGGESLVLIIQCNYIV